MTQELEPQDRSNNDTLECILSLRAIRRFEDKAVPQEVLDNMLEAARWCGSGKNLQPWQFLVIFERPTLEELSQMGDFTQHLAEAAFGIGLVMDQTGLSKSSPIDEGRVAQNLMLAAHSQGVGSCIAFFDNDEALKNVASRLDIPQTHRLVTIR